MTHLASRIAVTLVFTLFYAAFLAETLLFYHEFGTGSFAFHISNLYAHTFLFFPIAGLLALIAFWRPAVLITDALGRGTVRGGRLLLAGLVILIGVGGWLVAQGFNDSNSRSLFEIAPATLQTDTGQSAADGAVLRSPIPEILVKMRINADGEGGLTAFRARCDAEWLRFSITADQPLLCFPTGTETSVAECCAARSRFRTDVNALQAASPSNLSTFHRFILPVKVAFLFLLLVIGLLLVQFRKRLCQTYGDRVDDLSLGVALGGGTMLLWPLMNAAHLETIMLLTGDGSANAYRITAPLITLGFGVFAVLLAFFHLRTYPHQVEHAAKIGGAVIAALGVFRYEEIVTYLSRTLGIGGGPVAIVVFMVATAALIATVLLGVTARSFEDADPDARAADT
ncbi:MAG: hypothetical protein AAFR41_09270 [Pseudomonadota bacterium]